MLGGSNCKMSGGKKVKRSGGSDCNKMQGGKRKSAKKPAKKVKRKGGGFCVGNLAEFDTAFGDSSAASSTTASAPAPAPAPAPQVAAPVPTSGPSMNVGEMDGGAKKRKSRKSRKAGPYAKFVKKHFASVQKKNPKFKATDCMKEIAKMWRAQKKK